MKTRFQSLFGVALIAALPLSASGSVGPTIFQFDDVSDTVNLYLNGSLVTGDIPGLISGFSSTIIPPSSPATDPGEWISFTLLMPNVIPIPTTYTQLWEPGVPPGVSPIVSDEFLLSFNPNANGYHVDFVSADRVIVGQGLSPDLSALEVARGNLVGFIQPPTGGPGVEFWVTSVPEPETYAMLLAGLGLLGLAARRRNQT